MTLQALARYALELRAQDIPTPALHTAKKAIMDLLAAAMAGQNCIAARAARTAAQHQFAAGPATCWFTRLGLKAAAAAYVNATLASAMDLDDGHRQAMGHPGASIIPAAMAMAEQTQADGMDLLVAIVVGYEVAIRIAAARDHSRLDTLSSGRWCGYGAAAAAGRLLNLPPRHLAQAMAVSGVLAPGLSAAGYSRSMGNSAKEGIGWATLTGMNALDLAAGGFTGPLDILDHPHYYDAKTILDGLGHEFAIEQIYFKPYSCCRWIHAAIDALIGMIDEHRIDPHNIHCIDAYLFGRALRLNNYPDPDCLEAAQYSVPFCLAAAALAGKTALLPMDAALLGRKDIINLATHINLIEDHALSARFPKQTPARVVVHAATGQYAKQVDHPLGDPANPMDWEAVAAKLRHLAGLRKSGFDPVAAIAAIEHLDKTGVQTLACLIGENAGAHDCRSRALNKN
jgi:2-methylcitrate dehydratase PrpD